MNFKKLFSIGNFFALLNERNSVGNLLETDNGSFQQILIYATFIYHFKDFLGFIPCDLVYMVCMF